MEKNRIRPIKSGKSSRMSYARQKEVLQMPNLIEVQKDSYQWFLDAGLKEAKEVVDGAPKVIKEGVSKAEAEEIKAKLEAEGASVELK